jgi:hypothetical protein
MECRVVQSYLTFLAGKLKYTDFGEVVRKCTIKTEYRHEIVIAELPIDFSMRFN